MLTVAKEVGSPIAQLCGVATPPDAVVLALPRTIRIAIESLARSIQPWVDEEPESPVVVVALLQGGKFFADRLCAELAHHCSADFKRLDIKVSTRDCDGRPLPAPAIQGDITSLEARRVLVVDDILDSGMTLRIVNDQLGRVIGESGELKTAVLIEKEDPGATAEIKAARPKADFVGLHFRDTRWFSGAGMDMPGDTRGVARESETIIAYPPVF